MSETTVAPTVTHEGWIRDYTVPMHDRPLAAYPLTSYRYRGEFGWVMIGAKSNADALVSARRSVNKRHTCVYDRLEVWKEGRYVPVVDLL
jgi:hypothetical protein